MDPRMINCVKMKQGCVPSSGLYATASALATMCGSVCEAMREKELARQVPSAVAAACEYLGFRPVSFNVPFAPVAGAGVALQPVTEDDSETIGGPAPVSKPIPPPSAFGMSALGGTMVFAVPSQCLSVAITVNQLSAQRSAALDVAKFVCKQLGLGEPVDL